MRSATQVQIFDEPLCISYSSNTIGKDMNPTILLSTMGK